MSARIYRPAKSPMQSGRGNETWILEFEPIVRKEIEPLMGYTSTSDMPQQVRMKFSSRDSAVSYAKSQNLMYRVFSTTDVPRKNVSYSDNFRFDRKVAWTH